jgi:hypothetical protein
MEVELDFEKLMDIPELFKKFSQSILNSVEESKVPMKEIPGIKVDLRDEIRIRFE